MFCEDLTQSDQLGYVEEFQYDGEGNRNRGRKAILHEGIKQM